MRIVLIILLLMWAVHAQFPGVPRASESSVNTTEDSSVLPNPLDEPALDSTQKNPLDSAALLQEKKALVKNYDHKEQVITASVFMASILVLMASMNNFNPKR